MNHHEVTPRSERLRSILRWPRWRAVRYGGSLVAVSLGLLFAWPSLADNLLASGYGPWMFMPHGHCYMWVPQLWILHLGSDSLIGLSYVAISLTLAYLVKRARQDIPFHWVFLAFGLFIIACGMTHFMEVWTLWNATYWLSGYVKLVTAVASVATAVVLPPLVPRTLALIRDAKLSGERKAKLESANQELETLYGRTKELDRLKTELFANVSHELRTPLALILGPAEKLLGSGNLTPEERRSVEVIGRNARSLLKHVNDLLDVAKLEAREMAAEYAEVDLAGLLRLAAAHFESFAAERQIDFTVDAPESVPAEADPDQLQRVFLNVLSNAFKFTPEQGRVRCALGVTDDRAVVTVGDSGPGVPPDLRDAIFERFRQGEGGTTRRFGGTGLGLAIAKEFVELNGGTIGVSEAPEGGALLRIELPLKTSANVEDKSPARQPRGGQELARQTIEALRVESREPRDTETEGKPHAVEDGEESPLVLIVEDNLEMNNFISDALSGEYRTAAAFDGEEGLQKATTLKPDLILSDVMMPGLGGDGLLGELRARPELQSIPVIMLTAKADDELRVRLLRGGARDYLMKPFSVEELRARVGNLVEMKRAGDVLRGELAGRNLSLEGLAQKVTSLLKREQEARQAAEAANRMKDEFLATVSHELRTPLTPIIGWARMLRMMPYDEATFTKALESIENNAAVEERIVGDLLDVSRIVTGSFRLDPRPVDVARIVETATDSVRAAADAKDIRLEVELDPRNCPVSGDPDRLQQVVWNLLSNAIKFTPEKGRVHVRSVCSASHVEITVSDTGVGITADFLPHVFERFRQADSSITRSYGGLGLGLSIVRHLVELHGGTVRAESPGVNLGASFTVRLPLLTLHQQQETDS